MYGEPASWRNGFPENWVRNWVKWYVVQCGAIYSIQKVGYGRHKLVAEKNKQTKREINPNKMEYKQVKKKKIDVAVNQSSIQIISHILSWYRERGYRVGACTEVRVRRCTCVGTRVTTRREFCSIPEGALVSSRSGAEGKIGSTPEAGREAKLPRFI